jgi:cephalosporin hydroxylase
MIKRATYQLVPRWAPAWDDFWWLRKKAIELRRCAAPCSQFSEYLAALERNGAFPACQKPSEILTLLELVAKIQPRFLCEIGTASGGTLFLLAQACAPAARMISIDLSCSAAKRRAFTRFAKKGQQLFCLQADSHAASTKAHVVDYLSSQKLDFLFIDGDHRYDGVSRDFEMYSPLVRAGGLIGFHDIVPDFKTRFGTPTCSNVGEVPRFWSEVRKLYPTSQEFVDDPGQDGYGIGVIHWPRTIP